MNLIKHYTNQPVTIEAIQFADDADTISNIHGFLGAETTVVSYENPTAPVLKINTLEGVMTAQVGDWIIKGIKGEFYPCKPDIFEATYECEIGTPPDALTGHNFGYAIAALKNGHRVSRAGWNGKGMFLFLLPAGDGIPTKVIHDPALRAVIESELGGETFDALGSVRMFTSDKKILTGWLASQTDMLAEDWQILN